MGMGNRIATAQAQIPELLDADGLSPIQRAFLEAYATLGTITAAAEAIGISRQSAYDWDHGQGTPFGDAFLRAKLAVGDMVEREAIRRAMEGESRMADVLLMFAVKRHKPEYRENYTVTHQGQVDHRHLMVEMTATERTALLQMALEHEQRRIGTSHPDSEDAE